MAYLEPQNFNPFPKTPNSHVACHRKASFFSNFSSFFFDPGLTSCPFFFLSLPPLRERREASGRFLSPLPLPFSLFSFPASSDFTIFSFLIIEKPLLPSLTYSFHHTLLHRNPPEACLWAFFYFFLPVVRRAGQERQAEDRDSYDVGRHIWSGVFLLFITCLERGLSVAHRHTPVLVVPSSLLQTHNSTAHIHIYTNTPSVYNHVRALSISLSLRPCFSLSLLISSHSYRVLHTELPPCLPTT